MGHGARRLRRFALALTLAACGGADDAPECPADGWCWERGEPLAMGGPYAHRVHVIGPRGLFYVGGGDTFEAHPVPTSTWIVSAAVLESGALWAADEAGDVWTSDDGESWREVPHDAPIRRLWGTDDGTVYGLVGASAGAHGSSGGGAVRRWTGERWEEVAPAPPSCVGTSYLPRSATELWAVDLDCETDAGAVVRRFDGDSWQPVGEPIDGGWFPRLEQWGDTVRVDILSLHQWSGEAWQLVDGEGYPQDLTPDEGAVTDGERYLRVPRDLGVRGAYAIASGERWGIGDGRVYLERDGELVLVLDRQPSEPQPASAWGEMPATTWMDDVNDAWGLAPDDVWVVTRDHRAARYDGARTTTIEDIDEPVSSVVGSADGTRYFRARDALYVARGGSVERAPYPEGVSWAKQLVAYDEGALVIFDTETGRDVVYRYDGAWRIAYESDGPILVAVAPATPDGRELFVSSQMGARGGIFSVVRVAADGGETVVELPPNSYGNPPDIHQLVRAEGEVWGLGDAIYRITGEMEPVPAYGGMRLHVGPDRFWLYTATQAASHPRPE